MIFQRARDFYRKHERWVPIAFFVLGFCFDALMLRRIDEPVTIVQQALYLIIAATLISVELIEHTREIQPPFLLKKVWKYREEVLHFMLGTLLNSYTIFYFKSSSALTSLLFIILLIGLLMINEFKRFGKSQTQVHMAFLSLCLVSYLVSLAPILLGFMGLIPFACSITASALVFYGFYRLIRPRLAAKPEMIRTHVVLPYLAMHALFIGLYFAHAIPPVPLSVSYMGIFHDIQREDGEYKLSYTRSKWRFWQHGDQTFSARQGDTLFCFARIFSPTRFKDKLQVRWLYYDQKRGWQSSDAIPMPVVGGREEGYRAVTKKNNYGPGDWRVQVETMDNREIGRIGFTIEKDEGTEPSEVKTTVQ